MNETMLINPFFITVEPMQRLLLVNFSKDPDEHYIAFEPQVFSNKEAGDSVVIIGWRRDGKVDVYYQSAFDTEDKEYNHTGKGLLDKVSTDFKEAQFNVTSRGVTAAFQFSDKYGRDITIRIAENCSSDTRPFSLLAPMGMATKNPTSFPLIYLYEFYFVRKKGAVLQLKISERIHKLDMLPIPIDGNRMSFSRYSSKPLIAYFNPAMDDYIDIIKLKNEQKTYKTGDTLLTLDWKKSEPAIEVITQHNTIHPIELSFTPPFPSIAALEKNKLVEGTFILKSHHSAGKIGGEYTVIRKGNEIKVKCTPSLGWLPEADKWELKVLYRLSAVFVHWPKTYEWTGYITERSQLNYYMHSKWKRINLK